jgi:thioredoxin-related protein
MKKVILLVIMAVSLIADIKWLSLDDALKSVKGQNKLIFIYMYSPYCMYCKEMEKTTFMDEKIAQTLNKYYASVKIDGENDVYPSYLKTRVSPTFFFLNSGGEKIERLIGSRDKSQLLFQLTRFRMDYLKNEGN